MSGYRKLRNLQSTRLRQCTLAVESLIRCKKEKAELDQQIIAHYKKDITRTKRKCKLRQSYLSNFVENWRQITSDPTVC